MLLVCKKSKRGTVYGEVLLNKDWSFIRVVFHHGSLSSGWSFIRVVSHQGGLNLIRVVFYHGSLSSGWYLVREDSPGWSLIMAVSHQVILYQGGLSLGVSSYYIVLYFFVCSSPELLRSTAPGADGVLSLDSSLGGTGNNSSRLTRPV